MKKRLFSALLAAALCFSLSLPVFAAEGVEAADPTAYTDAKDITHWQAVAALTQLGVINGKDDGAFHPTDAVTRAEAAKMMYLLVRGGKDGEWLPSSVEHKYSDTIDHWAERYIYWGSIRGYIRGRGDHIFDPESSVTVLEFAKMLLTVMGDSPHVYAAPDGSSWDYCTDERARHWNLYEGLPDELIPVPSEVPYENCETVPLTRETAAQLLYTALQKRAGMGLSTTDPAKDVGEFTSKDWDGTSLTIIQAVFHFRGVESLNIPAQPTV